MEHTIDAKGRKLGRLASEIAVILMGKDSSDFVKNVAPRVKVKVVNGSQIDISARKMAEKRYKSFSGYPSGLKIKSGDEVVKTHGYRELLRKAVYGMLPGNKLRKVMMKNLEVIE